MPIVDVQVIAVPGEEVPEGSAKALANAVATALQATAGRVWLRLEQMHHDRYAENGPGEQALPVFVRVLHADMPPPDLLALEAAGVANAVAACLNRDPENVHVEYAPAGRGRLAFGGKLLR